MRSTLPLIPMLTLLAACGGDGQTSSGIVVNPAPTPTPTPTPAPVPTPPPPPGPKPTLGSVVFEISFANDSAGFQALAADYAPGQEGALALSAGPERLPAPLNAQSGFAISAGNPSGDVFAFAWRLVTGLSPNVSYQVTVSLRIASNAPPGCPGGPGETVSIEAGASAVPPATLSQSGTLVVNFDRRANLATLGDFAQSVAAGTCAAPLYAEKTLNSGATAPIVRSDPNGQLWLVFGIDSRFAGTTKIYHLSGAATFSPVLD